MKNLKQYHTFINENVTLHKVTEHDLEKLFNDKSVIIDDITFKHGDNIYGYDLIKLAQGLPVKIKKCNCQLIIEDGIDFKTINDMIKKSPLNEEGAMYWLFVGTHPNKSK